MIFSNKIVRFYLKDRFCEHAFSFNFNFSFNQPAYWTPQFNNSRSQLKQLYPIQYVPINNYICISAHIPSHFPHDMEDVLT